MDQNLNKLGVQLDCIRTFDALPNDALVDLKMVSSLDLQSTATYNWATS